MGVIRTQAVFHEFDSYADYVDQSPANAEVLRTEGGDFGAEYYFYSDLNVATVLSRTSSSLIRRGSGRPDNWSFGFSRENADSIYWCGHECQPGHTKLGVFGNEFENVTRSGLDAYLITVNDEYFQSVADSEETPIVHGTRDRIAGSLIDIGQREYGCFTALVNDLLRGSTDASTDPSFEITRALIPFVSKGRMRAPSASVRRRTFERARNFLHEFAGEEIKTMDILRGVGCSSRALSYAFKEHVGVSPMAYLKLLRLNRARRELRVANARETKVADVANRWGFWHLGKFSRDYQTIFGRLPSEDLRTRAFLIG